MAIDAFQSLAGLIQRIWTDRQYAHDWATDPHALLASEGLTEADLDSLDLPAAMSQAASGAGLPASAQAVAAAYSGGAPAGYPPPPPYQPGGGLEQLVQHVNYATYQAYEGDEYVTQELQYIDNGVDVEVETEGDVYGDLEVETETTNVNATGDGAVAAGRDVENAATGEGSVLVDGYNSGQINTGDGAVQAFDDIEAPVNTGYNSGIIADGDVDQAVVGDGNQVAQVDGDVDESVINFGGGDVTNFGDADIHDSSIAVGGGNSTNVSDNYAEDGSAIGAGDTSAAQANTDVYVYDSFNETSEVYAENSVVGTEQGEGDQEIENEGDLTEEDFEDFDAY